MLIPNQRSRFNISSDITYLNCANMSPSLNKVTQAGVDALEKRSQPWKIKIDDWFQPAEELRSLFAKIIQTDQENIALIPSVSYGIAVAANNISLQADQKIIVVDQQYPSNIYAWRELSKKTGAEVITVKRQSGQNWTDAILEQINEQTGLVAIPNCHWTDGSLIDLERISPEVKKVNARFVIDASQSLGAYPLNIHKLKPDFLVTVGYKWLLGPYNLGYMYVDKQYCETGKPLEYSWLNKKGSDDFAKLVEYTDEYKAGARRFDFGESPSFIHVPMATAALTQILEWGVDNIQSTLSELTNEIERRATASGYETVAKENRVGHMIGVRLAENKISVLSKNLAENKIYASIRGMNLRVSPHLFNDTNDVGKLFEFL